jgi:hypothetical protein
MLNNIDSRAAQKLEEGEWQQTQYGNSIVNGLHRRWVFLYSMAVCD